MSRGTPKEPFETPVVEVKMYQDGELVRTRLCESADEAAALVAHWEDNPGAECTVQDLSASTEDQAASEVEDIGSGADYPGSGGDPEG